MSARRVRRIIKVRVGDTFEGTFIRQLAITREPRLATTACDEYVYMEVEQDALPRSSFRVAPPISRDTISPEFIEALETVGAPEEVLEWARRRVEDDS